MIPLAWRASAAGLLRYPLQSALAVLGLALGVMVFVAVDIANQGARRAFDLSMQALAGRATHHVVAGPAGLADEAYVGLRRDLGLRDAAPVVELSVRYGSETLRVLGIDPLAERSFRGFAAAGALAPAVWRRLLLEPGAVLIAASTAARIGVQVGEAFEVGASGRRHTLTLVGLLDEHATRGLDNLAVTDIASAQSLRGAPARLTRIDLMLAEDEARTLEAVRALLPPEASIVPASARARATRELAGAFTLNLTAMSLLAVVIGLFLIYNTMHFNVLRRRELFGVLRAIGVTRGEVLRAVLLEALLLGACAAALGILAGDAIAGRLLALVGRTLNDLYFSVTVGEARLSTASLMLGLVLGVVGSLASALVPALEAMSVSPVAAIARRPLERRVGGWLPGFALAGAALLAGAGVLAISSTGLAAGFAALAALLVGSALAVPWLTAAAGAALGRLSRRGPALWRHTLGGISAGISRTGVAVAALVVALSATVGVALMVGSFRVAVQDWLESTLRADIYVRPADGFSGVVENALDPAVVESITGLPAVAAVSVARFVEIADGARTVPLFAVRMPDLGQRSIRLLAGGEAAWRAFDTQAAVLVSEPYAFHNRLAAGDTLRLPTPRGAREFAVAGIYRDYGSDRGVVMMRLALYREYWDDAGISSLGVYLRPGEPLETATASIRAVAEGRQALGLRANRDLKRVSLAVFDRTFEITGVLRWLTVIVAVLAIVTSLGALQLERSRELALLRALGMTPLQLALMIVAQTVLLGLFAGLLAVPVGIALSQLLIHVINARAFGWSMDFVLLASPLAEALAIGGAVALLAGIVPAWQSARRTPAAGLHGE